MNIALIIIYVLCGLSFLQVANKHGQPKGDYNVLSSLIDTVALLVLVWWAVGWQFI